MSEVDFGLVKDELEDAEHMHVMQVLVRASLYHGLGNRPNTLIVTDKALYLGGSQESGGKFKRIPIKSINSSSKAGFLLWECVEISHMGLGGVERIYLCPFSGNHLAPLKDREMLELLLSILNPINI